MTFDPYHMITCLNKIANDGRKFSGISFAHLLVRKFLTILLETMCRKMMDSDTLVNVNVDVFDCCRFPRKEPPRKSRDVLLNANVCHFMKIYEKIIMISLQVNLQVFIHMLCQGQMTILIWRFFKSFFTLFYIFSRFKPEWQRDGGQTSVASGRSP